MKKRVAVVFAVMLAAVIGLTPGVGSAGQPAPTVSTTLIWATDCSRATVYVTWSHIGHATGATYKLEESDGLGGFTEIATYTEDPFAQRTHDASGWSFYDSYSGRTIRAFAEIWTGKGGHIGRSDYSTCTPAT